MASTGLVAIATILFPWLDCFREGRSTKKTLLNVLRVFVVAFCLVHIVGLLMWLCWIVSGHAPLKHVAEIDTALIDPINALQFMMVSSLVHLAGRSTSKH